MEVKYVTYQRRNGWLIGLRYVDGECTGEWMKWVGVLYSNVSPVPTLPPSDLNAPVTSVGPPRGCLK